MTFFTINDEEEPIEIKDGKGIFGHFCAGANLDEDAYENRIEENFSTKSAKDYIVEDSHSKPPPGRVKTALFWICGIESVLNKGDNKLDHPVQKVDTSIDENKWLARLCDVNAVIAISLSGFFIAFFNRYDF